MTPLLLRLLARLDAWVARYCAQVPAAERTAYTQAHPHCVHCLLGCDSSHRFPCPDPICQEPR